MHPERSDIPKTGDIIAGKYEVERVLGVGVQLGRRVAVKFMRAAAAADSGAVSRFFREARAAAALSSEHVTRVIDVGTLDDGAPYMVMEYLAGSDLGALLKERGPMAVADAVTLVLQACEAIAEAHALGIAHRDLKPSNIFVAKSLDGRPLVKVLDFGISKMADAPMPGGGNALTASGAIMGSPSYMSPEQVRSAKEVDPRTDIWALGVVLYELLTNTPPFGGDTLGETFAKILTDPPRPMAALRPDVPTALVAVVWRCLEKSVERRIQSVAALPPLLLPFAGHEGARSVERILHVAGAQPSSRRDETQMAPGTLDHEHPGTWPRETGPAWLRSAARVEPPRRRRGVVATVVTAGALVSAGAIAIYVARESGPDHPGAASAAAASILAAPSRSAVQPAPAYATVGPAAEGGLRKLLLSGSSNPSRPSTVHPASPSRFATRRAVRPRPRRRAERRPGRLLPHPALPAAPHFMKPMSSKQCWLFAISMVASVAATNLSHEAMAQEASAVDIAQARELLNQGLDLRKRGDNAGALEKLKGAHALGHTPITGLELGRTYLTLGRLVEAREALLSIGRIPVRAEETIRSKTARQQSADLAEQLRLRIPTLTVRITGVPVDSVSVTIDGAVVPTVALAAPRLLDPGGHDVSARSTTGGTAETRVELKEGETRDVELKIVFTGGTAVAPAAEAGAESPASSTLPATAGDAPVSAFSPAPSSKLRVPALALMGGGLVVGGAGAVLLFVESAKAVDANTRHDKSGYDSASTAWTVGLVAAIAGGVALGSGGILLFISRPKSGGGGPQASIALRAGPGVLQLGGTW